MNNKLSMPAIMVMVMVMMIIMNGQPTTAWPAMPDPCGSGSSDKEWAEDGFVLLVMTWPGAFCKINDVARQRCPATLDPTPNFTLHGLWPNYADEDFPYCCPVSNDQWTGANLEAELRQPQNADLARRVARRWPELGSTGFLAYEYDKHGTCALDWFDTPLNFVRATLDAADSFDFFKALRLTDKQLRNGVELQFGDLQSRLQSAVGHKIKVICQRYGNKRVFAEVRACLKRSSDDGLALKPFDCPSSILNDSRGRCPSGTTVLPWPLQPSTASSNTLVDDDFNDLHHHTHDLWN